MTNDESIYMLQNWNKDLALMDDEEEGIECHELAIKALEKAGKIEEAFKIKVVE